MRNRIVFLVLMIIILTAPVWATPVELRFTNADVNLGDSTVIPLTGNEYDSFGISTTDASRYIDARDPFSDAPNDVPAPCPPDLTDPDARCNFGLSNNSPELTRIDFDTPTPVSFDWWVIDNDTFYLVLDENGNVLTQFVGSAGQFGSVDVTLLASSILWSNNTVGFAQIANLRYDVPGVSTPEPSTLLLLGAGLLALSRRRRS